MALNTQPLAAPKAPTAPTPALAAIQRAAAAQGLAWKPLAAVAHFESGLNPTALGDGGHAFGLFQNNNAGGTITGDPNPKRFFDPNVSAQYAARAVKALGIQGESPQQQVADIVNRYERPAKPQPEIAGAQSYLATLAGSVAPAVGAGLTRPTGATVAATPQTTSANGGALPSLSLAPLQSGLDLSAQQNQRALDALGKISGRSTLAAAAPNLAALTQQETPKTVAEKATKNVPLSAATPKGLTAEGEKAVELAKRYLGTKYVFGGASPKTGFDCSGLIQFTMAQLGIKIPRTAAEQAKAGKAVPLNALEPGDALSFSEDGVIGHTGMYIGGGQFIQAPHTGDVVKISPLAGHYASILVGARRFT